MFAMGEDGSMIDEKKSTDRSEPSQKPIVQTETLELTPEQRESLRDAWVERNKDIMSGVPSVLPPLRDINHEIPLIDEQQDH